MRAAKNGPTQRRKGAEKDSRGFPLRVSAPLCWAFSRLEIPGFRYFIRRQRRHLECVLAALRVRDHHGHALGGAPLAEARREARGEIEVVVVGAAVEQHQRPGVTGGGEMDEPAAIAAEKIVLALVAPDDELEMRARAQVPADLEQHYVVELVALLAARAPEIGELVRILLVGEEAAAARGLGVVVKAVLLRQRDLRLATAPVEIMEPLAIHPALALGERGRQEPGAQRPQQPVAGARVARHHRERVAPLRHRALAQDLAGDDEIEAVRLHPLARLAQHEYLAVETGVEIGPVAVPGVDDDVLVLLDDLDDVQLDAELTGGPEGVVALGLVLVLAADGVGVTLDAEAGVEVDALDVDALVEDDARGQQRIQAAGDEGHGLARG